MLGGGAGALAGARQGRGRRGRAELEPIGDTELEPGEWIVGLESGGGGYGDPLERDPEAVRHDVLEGWVSRERAEADYGVIFDGEASDESLAVNVAQTSARREALRGDRDE